MLAAQCCFLPYYITHVHTRIDTQLCWAGACLLSALWCLLLTCASCAPVANKYILQQVLCIACCSHVSPVRLCAGALFGLLGAYLASSYINRGSVHVSRAQVVSVLQTLGINLAIMTLFGGYMDNW